MKRLYDTPEVLIIPLTAVQAIQLSGDDEWHEEIPEDDETEIL